MTRRVTLAIAAAITALLLSAGLTNAQEPPETATRLEPGLNLVGWVGEPTPVSQLFRDIPRLDAIWAWDAELRDWIVAAPGAPEWLGGLGRVTAGMGLRMQLGGDQLFLWRRSTEPTRGLVKLRTGWNLVAWSGEDGAAIGDVVKGIGWSLRTVRRWDAANQQWVTWTSPERSAQVIANTGTGQDAGDDAETPGIRRGEALWIEVARAVNWLQPTEILPRLVFPGGASEEVRQAAERLVAQFLTSFREAFGFEADVSAYDIWMPASGEALRHAALERGTTAEEGDDLIELWDSVAGWIDSFQPGRHRTIVLSQPQPAWKTWGLLAHEYFHVVQLQLGSSAAPVWITEGTAEWAEDVYLVALGDVTWPDLHSWNGSFERDFPLLEDLAFGRTGWWPYRFGWLATSQIIERAGADSWIELWRHLSPSETGPHRRWQSTPTWENAFHEVAGVSAAAFREAFASWAREQTQQGSSNDPVPRRIRGRVTDASGGPAGGLRITATRMAGDPDGDLAMLKSMGWTRATTTPEGRFEIGVTHSGNYRISLDLGGGCTRHYSAGELINDGEPWNDWQDAQPVKVGQSDVSGIDVQLPPNVCGWQIRGRVVGPSNEPLAGVPVTAFTWGLGANFYSRTSATNGSFAITVATPGHYYLQLDLAGGCRGYHGADRITANRNEATSTQLTDDDVDGLLMRVPSGMCAYQIKGHIRQANGEPLAYTPVFACLEGDGDCVSPSWEEGGTDYDGAFAIAVPTEGDYRVWFDFEGCTIYFGTGSLTTTLTERPTVHVEGRDVRLSPRQIPVDVCRHQITGSITKADGQPLADIWLSACLEVNGECSDWSSDNTDDDGEFAITAPIDGRYSFWLILGGCNIHFSSSGFTTDWQARSTVRVEGRSVRLNPRQIPAGMCAHRISGRIVDSKGAPISGEWIEAQWPGGVSSASIDADGRFEVRVSSDGTYTLGVVLREHCWYGLEEGALGSWNNPVRVSDADVTGIVLRLPGKIEELCE